MRNVSLRSVSAFEGSVSNIKQCGDLLLVVVGYVYCELNLPFASAFVILTMQISGDPVIEITASQHSIVLGHFIGNTHADNFITVLYVIEK